MCQTAHAMLLFSNILTLFVNTEYINTCVFPVLQIHDNARLLELRPERKADIRGVGGEPRPDTVGDGQPGVRGLRAAATRHAAHQPGVVRRKRSGQLQHVIRSPYQS